MTIQYKTTRLRFTFTALAVAFACSTLCSSPVPAQTKDYSAGFAKFYELGLPNVKDATYVKLDVYSSGHMSYSHSLYELQRKGNAWMLEENKDGLSRFVRDACRTVAVYDHEQLQKTRMEKARQEAEGDDNKKKGSRRVSWSMTVEEDGKIGGTWQEASLEKDIEKVVKYLKKQKAEADGNFSQFSYSDAAGSLFLSAIHYHSQGYTNEANEIVGLVFELAGQRRTVLLQALNKLADSQYDAAVTAFFSEEASWDTLTQALDRVMQRFPAGWNNSLPVKRLLDKVRAQVGQPENKEAATAGLSDTDKAILQAMVTAKTLKSSRPRSMGGQRLWILDAGQAPPSADKDETASPLDTLQSRGMASIPLLIAMLDNDTLTRIDLQQLKQSHVSYGYSSDDTMSEERIQQLYDALRRPASVSDIAREQLVQLLITGEEQSYRRNQITNDDLRDGITDWYADNKDKPAVELARLYLIEGDDQQQQASLHYLVKHGTEADMASVEAHILEDEENLLHSGVIRQYVAARGEKAKDFVDALEAKLKEQSEAGDEDDGDFFADEDVTKMVEQTLKSLRDIVSAEPATNILADVVSGNKTFAAVSGVLRQRLSRETPATVVTLLLDAAVQVKDPNLARDLIYMAAQAPHMRHYNMGGYFNEEPEEPEPLTLESHAAPWKRLAADTRPVNPDRPGSMGMTLGQAAAWTIESLYGEEGGQSELYAAYQGVGPRLLDLISARASARLEGKSDADLTPYPSAEDVTPARLTELENTLARMDIAALQPAIASLPLAEVMALATAAETNTTLNTALAPLAQRVTAVDGDLKPLEASALSAAKGKTLTRDTVDTLQALCLAAAEKDKAARLTLSRGAGLNGVTISVQALATNELGQAAMHDPFAASSGSTRGSVNGMVHLPSGGASAQWFLDAPPATGTAADGAAEDDDLLDLMSDELDTDTEAAETERQAEFWKKVDAFVDGEGNVCRAASITFTGVPAPKQVTVE